MIYGLLLRGGKSSRMGKPKHELLFNGQTLEQRSMDALNAVCDKVFLSLPHGESSQEYPFISDLEVNPGPLGGLVAAFNFEPKARWVVLACDLPNVGKKELTRLVENGVKSDAVCYLNPYDSIPEGHCTLYAPSAANKLSSYVSEGNYCLRHFLEELDKIELECLDQNMLTNLNYPEDFNEWKLQQSLEVSAKKITVEYFAKLKQDAQCAKEVIDTSAITVAGLWEECRMRRNLSLKLPQVKVAVNNEFRDWNYQFKGGDLIAFMPPFAGG